MSFITENNMRKTHSKRVINTLSTMEKPNAPNAVKGSAGTRNHATWRHLMLRHPITERDRLLMSCAMVDTGTATCTPKKKVMTGSRIMPPPKPTEPDRAPAIKPTIIKVTHIIV